jgi:hypothetical protein
MFLAPPVSHVLLWQSQFQPHNIEPTRLRCRWNVGGFVNCWNSLQQVSEATVLRMGRNALADFEGICSFEAILVDLQ